LEIKQMVKKKKFKKKKKNHVRNLWTQRKETQTVKGYVEGRQKNFLFCATKTLNKKKMRKTKELKKIEKINKRIGFILFIS